MYKIIKVGNFTLKPKKVKAILIPNYWEYRHDEKKCESFKKEIEKFVGKERTARFTMLSTSHGPETLLEILLGSTMSLFVRPGQILIKNDKGDICTCSAEYFLDNYDKG
jgi:hypothetical protein